MIGNSAVCTLFEGNYIQGVLTLTNSLYRKGYRGDIYAGYKGSLANIAVQTKENQVLLWPGACTLEVAIDLKLHFLPLHTDYHLTNYKPDFLLRLWDGPLKNSSQIFYFDPDIVVSAPWPFFDEWAGYGIALCEDINSPLPEFHPRRVAWRLYFGQNGVQLFYKGDSYVNGGYIGINKKCQEFLFIWKALQEYMANEIGGLSCSSLSGIPLPEEKRGDFAPFSKTDQDALNAAIEAWEGDVCIIGKEGMAFEHGTTVLPHALGQPKPWNKKYLIAALDGRPPSKAEKEFWTNAQGVIRVYNPVYVKLKKWSILLASFIGRFYRRY